jgi:glycerophosphoryl diester phosphodiesterase
MAAFQKAAELKADIVEFDVHLSRDNRCMVIHDETLERTSNGSGRVRDHSKAELEKLDMGSWFDQLNQKLREERELGIVRKSYGYKGSDEEYVPLPIPTERFAGERMPSLEEVLEWGKAVGMPLSIEIKSPWPFYYGVDFYPGLVEQVVELIARHGDEEKVMLHSFDHRACLRVKQLNPKLGTAISVGGAVYVNIVRLLREAQAEGLVIGGNYIFPELIQEVHAAGGYLFGWGLGEDPINQAGELGQQVALGVDFVSGGLPDLLRQVVESSFKK